MSNRIKSEILNVLENIEGSGSFMTSGFASFKFPGLKVNGLEEIAFPINSFQAKPLIAHAIQAPFGKGSETITDTSIRKTWEIDAKDITFLNDEWEKTIEAILKVVQEGLGIEKHPVKAHLYKLLIYEEGGFFLPHKDSEKEKGMFATMIVGLPARHSGGELMIRFAGEEEEVDFSRLASNYKIPFVAFYADCEHEIKRVTSGYRVCLVYNLVQTDNAAKLAGPEFGGEVERLTQLLSSLELKDEGSILPILLGHEYTPANFSLDNLKLHDRPRAEALIAAAHKAGYYAKLGLVTHYKMGNLEGVNDYYDRYSRYDDDDDENGYMGDEIYEEYTRIENWGEDGMPTLGSLDIPEKSIISYMEVGEGNPTEQEQEGYTGNAGMTIEYWYHYGAIVLWKKSGHMKLIANLPVHVRLEWLDYFIKNWSDKALDAPTKAKQLIADIQKEDVSPNSVSGNFSSILAALSKIGDQTFIKEKASVLLSHIFDRISVQQWINILQTFEPSLFGTTFSAIRIGGKISEVEHSTNITKALNDIETSPFVLSQLNKMPSLLDGHDLSSLHLQNSYWRNTKSRKEHIKGIIGNVLDLAYLKAEDDQWNILMIKHLTKKLPRPYVHKVIAPILSENHQDSVIRYELKQAAIQQLQEWTKVKPTPPENWTREVPTSTGYYSTTVWKMLAPFLESPTQKTFDYVKNQSDRSTVERVIASVEIDLKCETIKRGRPYTLRIHKTQTAYQKKLKIWTEDMALLEALK